MIPIPIQPIIYAPGSGGAPGTTTLADIRPAITRYQDSIRATGGFEACTIDAELSLADAIGWLDQLMASIVVYSPAAGVMWEGYLAQASIQAGQERVTVSLGDLANAVRVRYQPRIGPQTATTFTTDSDSISRYGRKELIYSTSGLSDAGALALRAALLEQRRRPPSDRSSDVSAGAGAGSAVQLSLTFSGWYGALGWLTTSSSTSTPLSTTTQLQNLVTAYNATNAFYSTTYTDVASSGVSDTQEIEDDTTCQAKIERLLSLGDSAGERLAWGVYVDRRWRVNTWAGATPDTIAYYRWLGDGRIYTPGGAVVDAWDVRPDAMYQVVDLIDPQAPSGSIDAASRYYVERVTRSIDRGGMSVRLEPARSSELDVLLARIR